MNRSHSRGLAVVALATLLAVRAAWASDIASPAEAQQRLSAIVDFAKSKGAAKAVDEIMAASDPFKCKYKDMTCLLVTFDGKFLANTAQQALIGTSLPPDFADVDGVPIVAQQFGPAKAGKTKWEAKFKFTVPNTKKIVPRWSFCETAGPAHIACVVVSQP